jgi:hypothetical protein
VTVPPMMPTIMRGLREVIAPRRHSANNVHSGS